MCVCTLVGYTPGRKDSPEKIFRILYTDIFGTDLFFVNDTYFLNVRLVSHWLFNFCSFGTNIANTKIIFNNIFNVLNIIYTILNIYKYDKHLISIYIYTYYCFCKIKNNKYIFRN